MDLETIEALYENVSTKKKFVCWNKSICVNIAVVKAPVAAELTVHIGFVLCVLCRGPPAMRWTG